MRSIMGMTVLIADDSALIRENVIAILRAAELFENFHEGLDYTARLKDTVKHYKAWKEKK